MVNGKAYPEKLMTVAMARHKPATTALCSIGISRCTSFGVAQMMCSRRNGGRPGRVRWAMPVLMALPMRGIFYKILMAQKLLSICCVAYLRNRPEIGDHGGSNRCYFLLYFLLYSLWRSNLHSFDYGSGAQSTTATHSDQAVFAVSTLKFVQGRGDQPCTG